MESRIQLTGINGPASAAMRAVSSFRMTTVRLGWGGEVGGGELLPISNLLLLSSFPLPFVRRHLPSPPQSQGAVNGLQEASRPRS